MRQKSGHKLGVEKSPSGSLEDLFEEYRDQVMGFAYKNLKSETLAKDIVQDVFLVLCQKDLTEVRNIRSFIFQVTQHKVVDLLRIKAKSRVLREEMWFMISEKQQAADQTLIEAEYFEHFNEAKELLTPQQRLIFELSRKEGLTHRKIAEQLNLSPNTVKNHMVSALKTLREYLQINSDMMISAMLFLLAF